MKRTPLFFLALVLSCASPAPEPSEGLNSPCHLQEVARTDYDQAVRLTEEGMMRGEISPYVANLLLARITYNYTDHYVVAAEYLQKALELEESKDPAVQANLRYRLATILKNEKDYTALFAACTEGKEDAHAAGMPFLEHSFDFMVGTALFDIGEDDKGFGMMKEALSAVSKLASSEEDYGHLLYFSGLLINDYLEVEDYPSVLEECQAYENRIDRMQKVTPEPNLEYIDCRRFYLDMYRALCFQGTGDRAAAEKSFKEACARDFAKTQGGLDHQIMYYAGAGDPDSILAIYREELPYLEADTVTRAYRKRIDRLRDAYVHAGMDSKAREYEARYNALSRLLEEKEQAEGIQVNAARYDAKSSRIQLAETISSFDIHRRRMTILMIVLLVVSLLLIFIIVRVNRERDLRRQKEAESLEKGIRSLQRQVSIIAERGMRKDFRSDGTAALPLSKLIEDNQLYLNKNLNRESAASLLGVSQKEISAMLAEMEPGLSFPDYIKGLRIRHALKLMGENPEIAIGELADRCGFYTIRTLQRSFLSITGKTPSEYARGLKK